MKTTETFEWNGITIEVGHDPNWMEGVMGIEHLELRSKNNEKLPVTETGYRSEFLQPGAVEAAGGPTAFALGWLNEAAKDAKWQEYEMAQRQPSLF